MSLNRAPVGAIERPGAYRWDVPKSAMAKWGVAPLAAEADETNTISIYDQIGEDYWSGEGFTAKRMAAALRNIGANPVTVNVNSPGGDMFEGLAIYNLLAEHPAEVTIRVMGIAASAASIIAMAGDKVLMGTGTMIMVHRAWGLALGNHHDFAEASSLFQKFDEAMASIYVERTGLSEAEIFALLDGSSKSSDGTFMTVTEAIDKGFADGKFEKSSAADAKASVPTKVLAKRRVEAALAAQGMSRKERYEILNEIGGERDAAPTAKRDAGEDEKNLSAISAALTSNLCILGGPIGRH
ncbi:head maturation protease, ClpP-related [Aminobacter sp. AP02]|uniref:head maturation protease, ClpP-related n=1 Tax=Aminobacter sp. AP02 TaxID=2135737 RepID=UPI000D6D0238|nr:head maturation protease, ClpP-related [Aminobacter sp. AP02]PWK65862.1 ATP-dependent protease ClpP protease subunit [Aminobacter sp. AP02]